ncbi:MAG TPA: hypothetical protein EYN73_07085 [Chromatiaceae bacterium]|jgi:hypothetical protein|nr:hypothetical protein [Chromatiaceae bacterium]HIN83108.1 hypothetical protein [Chromatiales bacterium]HIO76140.1 hypothetical protein [Gammaproteobacteria bacterium]HIB83686.1 hypothetical protein [Chromatiaceae bacterium]HIO14917.1 hypothetical protein [Chromatiales bacterium]
MLRALILGWLIVCTFGYGSVMAFDIHIDAPDQHENHAGTSSNHADDSEDQPGCDHCCHSSAHATGLASDRPVVGALRADIGLSSYYVAYYRLPSDPPDHPPRS